MRFTTKTEYGLLCMVYLADHAQAPCVTLREIAKQRNYPAPYLEKIFQALKKAGLVKAHHGNQGGYSLAYPPSKITVKQVIDALEGATFELFCQPDVREDIICTHFCLCGVKPIWRKTKQLLDEFYGSITLDMLTGSEMEVNDVIARSVATKQSLRKSAA